MEFTLKKWRKGGEAANKSISWSLFFKKILSSLYCFQNQGKPKKEGWGRGFALHENPFFFTERKYAGYKISLSY